MKQKIEKLFLIIHSKLTLVLLVFVYIILIGPTSLYVRLIRHKYIRGSGKGSTWVDTPPSENTTEAYLRQF